MAKYPSRPWGAVVDHEDVVQWEGEATVINALAAYRQVDTTDVAALTAVRAELQTLATALQTESARINALLKRTNAWNHEPEDERRERARTIHAERNYLSFMYGQITPALAHLREHLHNSKTNKAFDMIVRLDHEMEAWRDEDEESEDCLDRINDLMSEFFDSFRNGETNARTS